MARYDLPAEIDTVLSVTGKQKLKYIGYSRGSSLMFIGLSMMEEEYFAGKVSKFIAISPCIYTREMKFYGKTVTYDGAVKTFSKLAD